MAPYGPGRAFSTNSSTKLSTEQVFSDRTFSPRGRTAHNVPKPLSRCSRKGAETRCLRPEQSSRAAHSAGTKNAPGARSGALESSELVPHIGFEPMISALRGLCPRPLDECGIEAATLRPAGRDNIRPRPGVPIRVLGPEPDQSLCDSRKARTPSATCW